MCSLWLVSHGQLKMAEKLALGELKVVPSRQLSFFMVDCFTKMCVVCVHNYFILEARNAYENGLK